MRKILVFVKILIRPSTPGDYKTSLRLLSKRALEADESYWREGENYSLHRRQRKIKISLLIVNIFNKFFITFILYLNVRGPS